MNEYGETTFSAPVTVKALWEEKESIIHTDKGEQIVGMACAYVNSDLSVDLEDYLFNGISTETNPVSLIRAYKIRKITRMVNYNGQRIEVKLWV